MPKRKDPSSTAPTGPVKQTMKSLGDKVFDLESRLGGLEDELGTVKSDVGDIKTDSTAILAKLSSLVPDQPPLPKDNRTPGGGKMRTRSTAPVSTSNPIDKSAAPRDFTSTAQPAQIVLDVDAAAFGPVNTALLSTGPNAGTPAVTDPRSRPQSHDAPPTSAHLQQTTGGLAPRRAAFLPISMQESTDPIINMRVQSLLDTAQHITGLKGRPTHPHDYITRGPTRVKTSLALLEIPEYLYGLHRHANSDHTPALDKPKIQAHFLDVIQDAKDFKWEQVREWSEEVLTGVAEGTLVWSDPMDHTWFDPRITALRSETSRVRTGRLFPSLASVQAAAASAAKHASHEATPRSLPPMPALQPSASAPQPNAQPRPNNNGTRRRAKSSANRTDVPCEAFNTATGCTKQDGHVDGNVQHGHHCSWCRTNLQVLHFHTHHACNIKHNPRHSSQPFRP